MRAWLVVLCLALADPASAADSSSDNAGTAAGAFLRLPPDARMVGLGQAGAAAAEDATAVYWNPAGLAAVDGYQLSFTHAALFRGLFYDYLAFAMPTQAFLGRGPKALPTDQIMGSIGLGIQYLNSGPISEVDNTGTPTGGSFTPQDFSLTAAWGSSAGPFDLGVAGKLVSSSIKDSASTYGVDAGARLRFTASGMKGALGASVHNLFGKLKFINESDPLPVVVRTGLSIEAAPGWLLAGDLDFPSDANPVVGIGTEYRQGLGSGWSGALRIGYNSLTAQSNLESMNGLSLGGGLGYEGVSLDYAWLPYGLLGQTHRISLTMKF